MAHANARLNLHGRRLLISRVIDHGRPVAHVAKEFGVSRQCATAGSLGSEPRATLACSIGPRGHATCPRRTPAHVESGYFSCDTTNIAVRIGWAPSSVWRRGRSRRSCTGTGCRTCVSATPWLDFYNTGRRHSAIGGLPPLARLS